MDIDKIKLSVEKGQIEWQKHALERMMERGISRDMVKIVLQTGEVIEDYPYDKPYPSALFLGWYNKKPIHVVVAINYESEYCFVITAYEPDFEHFNSDYKTRRLC
jgi:hypothetical protein